MKRSLIILLCLCLCLSPAGTALADAPAGQARAVIAADLTEEQITQVYELFGVKRGSVTELAITNEEERQYLDDLVDEALIGTHAISCVYLELLSPGEGLQIETHHLTWCSREMILSALVTAGIDDAKIIVAAPFDVSGTAALSGVYKAYEDMSGQPMDDVSKLVSTQELVVTGDLAEEIGSYDAVTIVNELKLLLSETRTMSDESLAEEIRSLAEEYKVPLKDSQIEQLITLCRSLEKLDAEALRAKVQEAQDTIKRLAQAREKAGGILKTAESIFQSVRDFFRRILSWFGL